MTDDEEERARIMAEDEFMDPPPEEGYNGYEDPNPRAIVARTTTTALAPPPLPTICTPTVKTECSRCKHVVAPFYRTCPKCEGDRNRDKVDRLERTIKEFKDVDSVMNPERERQLVKQLEECDHPDVKGFLQKVTALREEHGKRSVVSPSRKRSW